MFPTCLCTFIESVTDLKSSVISSEAMFNIMLNLLRCEIFKKYTVYATKTGFHWISEVRILSTADLFLKISLGKK